DAILVLREAFVLAGDRERPPGEDEVLIGREDNPPTERILKPALPPFDDVEHGTGGSGGVPVHPRIRGVIAQAQRPAHTRPTPTVANGGNRSRKPSNVSSSTSPSLMPGQTTT